VPFRAARGNFGLVWVQGKGAGKPAYALWSIGSAQRWPAFAEDLNRCTGVDLQLSQPGGLSLCSMKRNCRRRPTRWASSPAISPPSASPTPMKSWAPMHAGALPACRPRPSSARVSARSMATSAPEMLRSLTEALTSLDGELKTGQQVEAIEYRDGVFSRPRGGTTMWRPNSCSPPSRQCGIGADGRTFRTGPSRFGVQVLISERSSIFSICRPAACGRTGDGGVQIGDSPGRRWFRQWDDDGRIVAHPAVPSGCSPCSPASTSSGPGGPPRDDAGRLSDLSGLHRLPRRPRRDLPFRHHARSPARRSDRRLDPGWSRARDPRQLPKPSASMFKLMPGSDPGPLVTIDVDDAP